MSVRGPANRNMSTVMSAWSPLSEVSSSSWPGSRQVRVSGSLGPTASALVRVPRAGRVFRRRWASIANETRRDPRSRSNAPRRRTARICSVRVIVLEAFPSVCWIGAQGRRARTPARLARLGRFHRAGGITPVKHDAGPAVKTGNPSLSPRGARSAVGGIRAWAGNPGSRASSSSTVLLVRASMCPRPKECCSDASPPSADSARAAGPSLSELAHRGVHKPLGVSVCMRLRRQPAPSGVCG